MRPVPGALLAAAILAGIVPFSACYKCGGSPYYAALEKVGIEKRDLLAKRVEGARDAQKDASTQFRDALQEYKALVGYDGGELEQRYEKLRAQWEDSNRRATEVRDRIAGVRKVSEALFREWEGELAQYSDASMRTESARELAETRKRCTELLAVMDRAAARMDPVLRKLTDQVLFLKHNLNARALGSLRNTATALEGDVNALIGAMESSIGEADAFVKAMRAGKG